MNETEKSWPGKEQLRKLLHSQWSAEERQSEKFTSILHSELGQLLTGVKLQLSQANSALEDVAGTDKVKQHIESAASMTDDIVKYIREMMGDLRSEVFENFGLGEALKWKLKSLEEQVGIRTSFQGNLVVYEDPDQVRRELFSGITMLLERLTEDDSLQNIDLEVNESHGAIELRLLGGGPGLDSLTETSEFELMWVELSERLRRYGGRVDMEASKADQIKIHIAVKLD
ncbi:MAG: hypothetical protein K9N46_02660 [Candidatus Marinimicrobia bacterium]|nr:hypothetical protein [Candidatus Neomarinimicrobiota bacterium]MCF7828202.1 hypothetical protein [Candidatus Neomarinimicrobiota bacterium]MCF7879623.1 hypothetical protein [Candidatus Neomarinimicrobiota bacterium]